MCREPTAYSRWLSESTEASQENQTNHDDLDIEIE